MAQTIADQGIHQEFFAGNGEMAVLMRAHDWSQTPLGPVSGWPQSLKTTVRIMLTSRYAMWMAWGQELTFFCNDAYRPTLGVKGSWALGETARKVWEEIWPDIGPRIEKVLHTGEATWDEGLLLFLERSGYPEETYHTFSYSPLADDSGTVSGMLCVVTEETERIIGERRLALLRDVAAALASVQTVEEVFAAIARCIEANSRDLPFTLTYLFDGEGSTARLVSTTSIPAGAEIAVPVIGQEEGDTSWPLYALLADPVPVTIDNLPTRFEGLLSGPWDKPPQQAIVFPIAQQRQGRPAGFLVAAINPYRGFDAEYQGFISLLAGQIASSLANARAYEEERRRAEALAELDRAKTAFFSNVSHEFRTPLTLMLGPVEEILARPEGEVLPENRELLTVAHRNGLRLLKLVNTLLDFTRIEAGRVQASYEPTDLADFTAELASMFRSAIEKAGMRLIVDCPPLSEPAYVDREMWEKIVLNLLSNAFKFTLEGEIEVRLRDRDGQAVLSVRDTGAGITEEQLPHIFERFHRVEGIRARTYEGTGIGLALVQELVKLHGGTVGVKSAVGSGTTFTVALPLGKAHLPPDRISVPTTLASTALRAETFIEEALRWLPEANQAVVSSPYTTEGHRAETGQAEKEGRARILLADDNADMREYAQRLLLPYYDVIAVPDGEEALRMVREARPDLVLSDVMMPRRDGFGLLRELRNNPETAGIPILLLSARAGEEARIEGLAVGADDYLTKPFSARELLARVSAHLELARIRREAEQAIRARESQLQTLFDAAPIGIYLVDSDFRIRAINPFALSFFAGIPDIPDPIGRDFDEVTHILWEDEYADEIVRRFRHTLETGEAYRTPERIEERRDRGSIEYYEWQINRIPLPEGRYGVVCYFRDITAQVLARATIAESEEHRRRTVEGLRAIAARAHCLLWYAEVEDRGEPNLHWNLLVADEEAARRFLPIKIPLGHSYARALSEARLPEDRARMAWGDEELRAGRSYRQEFRVRDADGNIRWLAEDVQVEEIAPNRWYAAGVCVDITERKQAEEEREKYLAEIETLNNRLQRAMTETHHRVKNNLQIISALIDMQRNTHEKMVPVSELARLSANVRALSVIHDILTKEAKAGSDQEMLSVKTVLERLLGGLEQTIGDRALVSAIDDAWLAGRQATALALATNELVSNALKHGKGQIEIVLSVQGSQAALEVRDDGPGFPEGFDAMVAANTGLDLVENIVGWDLRGRISYANRPEGGARITVTFPITAAQSGIQRDPEKVR